MLTEAKPISLPPPTSSHDVPQETFRALIGWAPEQWSVQARSSLISATPEQHLQAVLTCKAQVTKRPAFIPTNPITEIDENDLVRTIKARPQYAYVETEVTNAGGSCRLAIVNLEEVLAFQPLVRIDHLETRQVQESQTSPAPIRGSHLLPFHTMCGRASECWDLHRSARRLSSRGW